MVMTERELRKTVSSNLRSLRIHFGLSQTDVAMLFGLTRQAVCRWEKGQAEPSYSTLIRLCNYYGISMDAFHLLSQEEIDQLPTVPTGELITEKEEESQNV